MAGKMKRLVAFLVLLIAGVGVYTAVAAMVATPAPQAPFSGGMMGGMMGDWSGQGAQSPYSSLITVLSVVSIVLAVVGASGLVYTVAFPGRVKTAAIAPPAVSHVESPAPTRAQLAELKPIQIDEANAILRVLKPDELRVVEMLLDHEGSYLQKWIAKDGGMSRLQAHRVVSRLTERKLVTVARSGNTNEVSLAPWLMGKSDHEPSDGN